MRRRLGTIGLGVVLVVVAAACQPAAPDEAFNGGTERHLTAATSASVRIAAMAPAPGGKLWVAGAIDTPGSTARFVGRVLASGAWDTTFGSGGRTRFEAPSARTTYSSDQSQLTVHAGAGGSVLVARSEPWVYNVNEPIPTPTRLRVWRFGAEGARDLQYGTGGVAVLDTGVRLASVTVRSAVDADGRLLAVGAGSTIQRLTAKGKLDAAFAPSFAAAPTDVAVSGSSLWAMTAEGQVVPVSDAGVVGAPLAITAPPAEQRAAGRLAAAGDGTVVASWRTGGAASFARISSAGVPDATLGTFSVPAPYPGGTAPGDAVVGQVVIDQSGAFVIPWVQAQPGVAGAQLRLRRVLADGGLDDDYGPMAGAVVLDGTPSATPTNRAASGRLELGAGPVDVALARLGTGIAVATVDAAVAGSGVTALDVAGDVAAGFGASGTALLTGAFAPGATVSDVLRMPDGTTVLAIDHADGSAELARFTAAGAPDTGWATAGRTPDVGGDGRSQVLPSADGAVVLRHGATLTRYRADGQLDTAWAAGGHRAMDAFATAARAVVGPAGDIVAVTYRSDSRALSLVRFSASGTFLHRGAGSTPNVPAGRYDVAVDAQGRMYVLAGIAAEGSTPAAAKVFRFNPSTDFNGEYPFEITYGVGAYGSAPMPVAGGERLLLRSGNRALVVGVNAGGAPLAVGLNGSGQRDGTFGTDGVTVPGKVKDGSSVAYPAYSAAVLDLQGRLLLVGVTASAKAIVTRVTQAGATDKSFDGDGWAFTPAARVRRWTAVSVSPQDGKIALGGDRTPADLVVARLQGAGNQQP